MPSAFSWGFTLGNFQFQNYVLSTTATVLTCFFQEYTVRSTHGKILRTKKHGVLIYCTNPIPLIT